MLVTVYNKGEKYEEKLIRVKSEDSVLAFAPHCDDIIYGLFSLVQDCIDKDKPLFIAYMSYGDHQDKRKATFEEITKEIGLKLVVLNLNAFEDGQSNRVPTNTIVSKLDPLFSIFRTIYIPEPSHHQDHKVTYECCLAAMRFRNSLPSDQTIYCYNYVYNEDSITPNIYISLSEKAIINKTKVLKILDRVDNILKDDVNSIPNIILNHRYLASKVPGSKYAEYYRLLRSTIHRVR